MFKQKRKDRLVVAEYIERDALEQSIFNGVWYDNQDEDVAYDLVGKAPTADVVEVDKVAKLLLISFGGNTCACDFNCNDEWLWEKCKYANTECPFPQDELGCWKEYVKQMLAKMDGKGE